MKNNKSKYLIGLIISVYITFNSLIIFNLPSIFYSFISWIGYEEITII